MSPTVPRPPCSNPTPGLLLQSWLIDPPASSPLQRQAALLLAALLLPPRSALPSRDVAEVAPPAVSLAKVEAGIPVSVPSVTAGLQKAPAGLQKALVALAAAKSDRSP